MIERSAVYLDASAFVKLIVDEPCSAELAEYLRQRQLSIASRIADVEVRRAIERCGAFIDPERVERALAALTMVELDASLALFIDDLRFVEEEELTSPITALHREAQRQLPIALVGEGLPQTTRRHLSARHEPCRARALREPGAAAGPRPP